LQCIDRQAWLRIRGLYRLSCGRRPEEIPDSCWFTAAAQAGTVLPVLASNIVGHIQVEIVARRTVLLQLQGCEPDDWCMQMIELARPECVS
jgi:hypothetical protein